VLKGLFSLPDNVRQWLEVIGGTALCGTIVWLICPDDPLLLRLRFPWLILLPMLFALYYGSAAGGASLALIAGWQWILMLTHASSYNEFPVEFIVGSFIVVLITGQFSEVWNAKIRRLTNVCAYAEDRLVRLNRDYYILKLAHDKLVQLFVTKPATIRDALSSVRTLIRGGEADPFLTGAGALLELLVHHYQLSQAAFYRCAHSVADAELVAASGDMQGLAADDPLVKFALQKKTMAHINTRDMESLDQSRYLVAMPMFDHNDELFGMFVIADMPFSMLHEENLMAMHVVISYFVADIDLSRDSAEVITAFPSCPRDFADELVRLHRVAVRGSVPSRLVAFACGDEAFPILQGIKSIQRGLDFFWLVSMGYRHALIVLLPLADDATVRGYLFRIEQWLKEQHGVTLQQAAVSVRFALLKDSAPQTYLDYLFRQCGLIASS